MHTFSDTELAIIFVVAVVFGFIIAEIIRARL